MSVRRSQPPTQKDGPETIQERLVAALGKDKNIGGGVRVASGSLMSDIPYYISTQAAALDYAIGQPGVPARRVTTIIGREGSGKSTLALHLLAETQARGGIGILIDSEQRYTRDRAAGFGVNPDALIVIEGLSLERSFEAIEKTVTYLRDSEGLPHEVPITVVYDSIAGSPTEKTLTSEIGDVNIGKASAFLSTELKRVKQEIVAKKCATLVLVNQIRSFIDAASDPRQRNNERRKVMGRFSMIGEWPIIFESSLILYANAISNLGEDMQTGIRARIVVRKCGISPNEGRRAEVDIDAMLGIDRVGSKFDLLEELGVIIGGAGGRYVIEGREKSFYRKDFAAVLEELPRLESVIKEAPTMWTGLGGRYVHEK